MIADQWRSERLAKKIALMHASHFGQASPFGITQLPVKVRCLKAKGIDDHFLATAALCFRLSG